MNFFKINLLLTSLLLCYGCKGKNNNTFKVDNFSSGKAGEVILIIDKKYWSDNEANKIKLILNQPQRGLPQVENMFDVIQFDNRDFSANFQKHRNIVRFEISDNFSQNLFSIEKSTWSSQQIYVHITGNDTAQCLKLFMDNKDQIINELYNNDIKRIQVVNKSKTDPDIEKVIRKKFNISLSVPYQYVIANEKDDFLWLRYRTNKNDRFIMIFSTPITDSLSAEMLCNRRDSITKKYIPGAIKNSYPVITREYSYPIANFTDIGYRYGLELRGLWQSVGDKMGGPCYSFTFKDAENERYITIDGFVYAPQENKRNYLRDVEAIVKSIK